MKSLHSIYTKKFTSYVRHTQRNESHKNGYSKKKKKKGENMNYSYINKYIMGGNFHKEKGTGLNTGI